MVTKNKIKKIIAILKRIYPKARIALNFSNNFQLMVAVILSAQCTDKRVNLVTEKLFKEYVKISDWAEIDLKELERHIRPVGLYRNKAKNIINTARIIKNRFKNKIPDNMKELTSLPGIARKTANIILYNVFSKNEGIAIDTHVKRLSQRIGLTKSNNVANIEKDLMIKINRKDWGKFNNLLVEHGRNVCLARKPSCDNCPIKNYCNFFGNKNKKKD